MLEGGLPTAECTVSQGKRRLRAQGTWLWPGSQRGLQLRGLEPCAGPAPWPPRRVPSPQPQTTCEGLSGGAGATHSEGGHFSVCVSPNVLGDSRLGSLSVNPHLTARCAFGVCWGDRIRVMGSGPGLGWGTEEQHCPEAGRQAVLQGQG